jgi:uncharacterized surface protein with fasciclin (FAS1) repeats
MDKNDSTPKIIAAIAVIAILVGGVVLFTNSSDDDTANNDSSSEIAEESTQAVEEAEQPNIVETAVSVDDLSTLVTAVQTAGLVETLSDETASYTVFAPNNAAFDALPEGTLESLLAEDGRDDLTNILTYHVVDSAVLSSDLSDGQEVVTLQGDILTVSIEDGVVKINDATVLTPDVQTSNGVVHIIDSVLLPS